MYKICKGCKKGGDISIYYHYYFNPQLTPRFFLSTKYSPCAALFSNTNDNELHVMVPPPPINLNTICTFESIRYASGFIECSAACQAGSCCLVSDDGLPESSILTRESYSNSKFNGVDNNNAMVDNISEKNKPESCTATHSDVCKSYGACSALKGLEDIHGTPTDLVNSKCTPNHMKTEVGIDDCENACQPRSCCFTESEKRNCYEDNKVSQSEKERRNINPYLYMYFIGGSGSA